MVLRRSVVKEGSYEVVLYTDHVPETMYDVEGREEERGH